MLRIIAIHDDCGGVDVHVVGTIEIVLNGDSGRKVELSVEGAGTVAGLDAGRSGELVHVGGAGGRAVQALLDAGAFVLDLWELQVHFGHHAGNVETFGVWFIWVGRALGATRNNTRDLQRTQPLSWVLRCWQIGFQP